MSDEIKSGELVNSDCSRTAHKSNNKLDGPLSTISSTTTCDKKKEFTQAKKYIVFAVAAVSQILNQAGLSGLLPALPAIQDELNTTATITNVTVAMQSLMIGLLSAIWASYADGYGNIGSALSINIGMLLGFRLTGSIGAAASDALGAGMINDVFQDSERGGVLTQYLGWRSIFWGFVIGYSVLWLVIVFVLPETNLHPSQSKQECRYDFEATGGVNDSTTKNNSKTKATSWKDNMVNPFSSLKLLKFPNMLLCCSYLGLLGFTNNASAISFTWAYSIQYQFSPTFVGLFYIVGIIGNTAGTWLSGSMSDRIYMRRTNNAKMNDNPIYPEMRLSLKWQFVGGFFLATGFTTDYLLGV
ncbi:hypothetical protein INT45_009293 [Circinella minor]|uniref:Major facilitator superfamily (MFS) profile domain-containing protein n=1 Tax=Circinella minor TaxID=1195481 RepID=A0A8H7S1N0_9FUNG|nr:hypothetical protein INT45_009293 [Circinella minor]